MLRKDSEHGKQSDHPDGNEGEKSLEFWGGNPKSSRWKPQVIKVDEPAFRLFGGVQFATYIIENYIAPEGLFLNIFLQEVDGFKTSFTETSANSVELKSELLDQWKDNSPFEGINHKKVGEKEGH